MNRNSSDEVSSFLQELRGKGNSFSSNNGDRRNSSSHAGRSAPWFERILYYRKYQNGEGEFFHYPSSSGQSSLFIADLESMANSLIAEIDSGKLFWRLRDRSLPGFSFKDELDEEIGTAITNATIFYNCYISVKTTQEERNEFHNDEDELYLNYKEAIVVVSRWPFRQLAYDMLDHIQEALQLQTQPLRGCRFSSSGGRISSIFSSPKQSSSTLKNTFLLDSTIGEEEEDSTNAYVIDTIVSSVLEVAYNQISSWPPVCPHEVVNLNFLGDVINFAIPGDVIIEELNPRLSSMMLSVSLLETLGTLGLIQHLWTIWELIITGQDIVVVATNPVHCCEIVLAISSLLEPVGYVGDIRPYINNNDREILVLAATAQLKVVYRHESESSSEEVEVTNAFKKLVARNRSIVVGVTDIESLAELEDFSAAIFVDSTDYMNAQEKRRKYLELTSSKSGEVANTNHILTQVYQNYRGDISDAVFKGLRNRNAALEKFVPVHYKNDSKLSFVSAKKKSGFARFFNFKSQPVRAEETTSFRSQYELWINQATPEIGDRRKTWILPRHRPTAIPLTRIIRRIQQLHPDDRVVLGDQILRDNLQDISKAFIGSSDAHTLGQSADVSSTSRISIDGNTPEDKEAMEELLSQQKSLEMAREAELKGMWRQGLDDILDWVKEIPSWIVFNFATVLLWSMYLVLFGILAWFGIPTVVIVIVAFLTKFPERAPESMVQIVESILPLRSLVSKSTMAATTNAVTTSSDVHAPSIDKPAEHAGSEALQVPDFNGIWKRVEVKNYEAFLAAQGVNYLQRKVAASVAMQHTIVVDNTNTRLHLEEKGGPIDSVLDYEIDATKFKNTKILKAEFEDTVSWDYSYRSPKEIQDNSPPSPKLLILKKRLPNCPYELRVWRWLENSSQGRFLRLRAQYHPIESESILSKKGYSMVDVESICSFEYVGPASFMFPMDVVASEASLPTGEEEEYDVSLSAELPRSSTIVEEEILSTVSADPHEITSPLLDEPKVKKGWLKRRFSSKSILKEVASPPAVGSVSREEAPSSPLKDSKNHHSTPVTPVKTPSKQKLDNGSHDVEVKSISSKPSSAKLIAHTAMVDFSGTWIRTRTDNFEAFAEATGLSPLQRKVAAQMSLTHIITMNPPQLSVFRLQERGGPVNTDFTLTLGSDHDVAVMINGNRLLHRAWYLEPNVLIMFRRAEDGSFEHVLIRTLDVESSARHPQLILRSIHRDLLSGKEVEAISFFSKVGPSPNPPPSHTEKLGNKAHVTKSSTRGFFFKKSPSKIKDTMPTHDDESPSLHQAADHILVESKEFCDVDDDDDDAAVKKMREISSFQRDRQKENINKSFHRIS